MLKDGILYSRLDLKIQHGRKCTISPEDAQTIGKSIASENQLPVDFDFHIDSCLLCQAPVTEGDYTVETVALIPKRGHPNARNFKRVTLTLPRLSCVECSKDNAEGQGVTRIETDSMSMLSIYNCGGTNPAPSPTEAQPRPAPGHVRFPPIRSPPNVRYPQMRSQRLQNPREAAAWSLNSQGKAGDLSSSSSPLPGENPLDEPEKAGGDGQNRARLDEGFLVCTQLVKTGGADQAGLQVGDIFVKFGHFEKPEMGTICLKDIANFVRRSHDKKIHAVVLRRIQEGNRNGRRVHVQKIRLELTPLRSHDADGGGVLGAVFNTWPLPQPITAG